MPKKVIHLISLIFITLSLFFVETDCSLAANQKKALIRLEDVSPGVYDTEENLDKLKVMADYFYKEGVPFHVSVIPVYKDPVNNVEISIGDTGNPNVCAFLKTIRYMREKGGIIGLHGYTHQYLDEVTGLGCEFMERGELLYALPEYAGERARNSLKLMRRAGIPVAFWETPHYTGSIEQYKMLGNYFSLFYEPDPGDRAIQHISSWEGAWPGKESIIFVPTPLGNVSGEKDVERILRQLDKNDPSMLASFFFHPFQEFRFMYKMKAPQGYDFYVHETDSYLHRLISGFKERGYRFTTINQIIKEE